MSKSTAYSIKDLKRDFPDDTSCLEFIFENLHNRKCSCGGKYALLASRRQFQCSRCRFQIAPTAGTIFHKSSTPLTLWFHALFIFCHAKSGVSAKEMERQLGVTYKTAWRILAQIRKALKQGKTPLRGIVEMDTAFIGGRKPGGKNNSRMKEAYAAKSRVMVAAERDGRIRALVMPDTTADTIEEFVRDNVEPKNFLMTDTASGYARLDRAYEHHSVNHSKKEYARGGAIHINTVEAWFSHIKRSFAGTFKSISKQHLQAYLDAFVFHYNNRRNDKKRFEALLGTLLRA